MCPPLAFITALILLCMEFTSALIFLIGMFSHSSSKLFAIARECWGGGCSDVFLRACPVRPTNAQLGTNLDCTVASRVVQRCCLPESIGKLWLHEDGHYHAGKSFDAVALTELGQDEGSHLCILPLTGNNNQWRLHTMRNPSPYHNRPSPIPIPLENASVGKPFPTTSVQTTSPVSTKKGEPRLICEENTSPLPHWKASRSLCCHPGHTTRATCPIEWQTDVRKTGSYTKLAQPIPYGFRMNTAIMTAYRIYRGVRGREVTIAQMGKTNVSVLALRRHARTSRSGSVCDPSSFPQTSGKTFYGGNMHTEMPSDLLLPLPLH